MKNLQIPIARREGLVMQETTDELLVYDLVSHKAHCLNQSAAFVWKACDGNNTISEITKLFENEVGTPVREELIWLAIDQLSDKNLLVSEISANFGGSTRREVIKKLGLATVVALPIVASLTAPTSALASTSCACVNPGSCITQTNCPNQGNCNLSGICAP